MIIEITAPRRSFGGKSKSLGLKKHGRVSKVVLKTEHEDEELILTQTVIFLHRLLELRTVCIEK